MFRRLVVGYRLIFALLGLAAVATQLIDNLQAGRSIVNFLSYFTIESNILAIAVLMAAAWMLARGRESRRLGMFRAAATLYMLITGVVYWALLSRIPLDLQLTLPWVNTVLHQTLPIVVLIDWAIDTPRLKLKFARALTLLIYPIAFLAYSLVRGAIVNWYPYPFLNPAEGGYGKVAAMSCLIALFGMILVALLAWSTRLKHRLKLL